MNISDGNYETFKEAAAHADEETSGRILDMFKWGEWDGDTHFPADTPPEFMMAFDSAWDLWVKIEPHIVIADRLLREAYREWLRDQNG